MEADLPPDQRTVLITALLHSFPGTSAHSMGSVNNLTPSLPEPTISSGYGRRPRVQSQYRNPQSSLRQSLISEYGVGLPRDSWLKTSIPSSPAPVVVECDLDPGPANPEVHVIDTEIQCLVTTWKGSATGRCQGDTIWTAELAKVRQWMTRSQAAWPEIYLAASVYSDLA